MKQTWLILSWVFLLLVAGCAHRIEERSVFMQGRVVDIFGQPVADCTIAPRAWETRGFDRIRTFFSSSKRWSSRTLRPVQTDANGSFTCDSCDWRLKDAYTTIKVSKGGYIDRELKIHSFAKESSVDAVLAPSRSSLRILISGPDSRKNLIKLLALPRLELARNYFAEIGELRRALLLLIGDARAFPELKAAAHEAGFLLALHGAPEDRAIIEEWLEQEKPMLGFLELATVGARSILGPDYPASDNAVTFDFREPTFSIFPHDLASKTDDDMSRLYLGQWFYFDPVGNHAETGWWIAVLRKNVDGCSAGFLGTIWVKNHNRYFGENHR